MTMPNILNNNVHTTRECANWSFRFPFVPHVWPALRKLWRRLSRLRPQQVEYKNTKKPKSCQKNYPSYDHTHISWWTQGLRYTTGTNNNKTSSRTSLTSARSGPQLTYIMHNWEVPVNTIASLHWPVPNTSGSHLTNLSPVHVSCHCFPGYLWFCIRPC